MKFNELAPLGNLRTGDRFCFPKKPNEVWQVIGIGKKKPYVAFAKFHNGKEVPYTAKARSGYDQVRFLRHTKPAPGEEWMLDDLVEGDVFFMLPDVITEHQVLHRRTKIHYVVIQDVQKKEPPFECCDMGVVYVRKVWEVVA